MNMPSPAGRPPATAAAAVAGTPADGGASGAAGGPGDGAGTPAGDDPVGDRVDGTAQAPPGPGVGSAEWDLLTDDVRWSAEVFRLLGCDPGRGPLSLDRLPDRLDEVDRPQLRRMMTDTLIHGRHAYGTLQVRRPCGGYELVECAGEPVLGTDGTVTALRLLLRPADRA
ncbi:hypothetical protein ACFVHB_19720 [Kitasatospora sp. NPDC127111]|uniref:hypothetical protein n=1 Tax=Kitasatospora sp. NPDC127111 TaxID=3345363 RepID=UPI00362E0C91